MRNAPVVNVGGTVDKESCENFAAGIKVIFKAAGKNHIEQETIRAAIAAYSHTLSVGNVNFSSCNITAGDKND